LDTDADSDGSDDLLQTMPERPRSEHLPATTGRNVAEVLGEEQQVLEEDRHVYSTTLGLRAFFSMLKIFIAEQSLLMRDIARV
jgi:hypothetical protein